MQEPGELTAFGEEEVLKPSVYGMQDHETTAPSDQERRNLRTVLNVALQVGRHPDPRNACQTFANEVMLTVRPGAVVAIFIMDAGSDRLNLMGSVGLGIQEPYDFQIQAFEGSMFGYEAIIDKRTRLYNRTQIEPFFTPTILQHHEGRVSEQILVIPILYEGEVIGIMNIEHYDARRPFTDAEVQLAEMITNAVSNHLRLARMYENSLLKEQEMNNLNRVIQTINSTLDIDTILKTIKRSLSAIFKFDVIFIQLVESERNYLKVHSVHGNRITSETLDKYKKLTISVESEDSISLDVMRKQVPEIFPEVDKNTPIKKFERKLFEIQPFRSIAFFPLIVHQEEIGF